MVDVVDEHENAGEHQHEGYPYRDGRHVFAGVEIVSHAAEHEQRVGEGGDEQAQRVLGAAIAEEGAHDARGELVRGKLEDEHRNAEYESRERDHGRGDGADHRPCSLRAPGEDKRVVHIIAEAPVDCGRGLSREERQQNGNGGDEPEALSQSFPPAAETQAHRADDTG
jgi:hypothetical protein